MDRMIGVKEAAQILGYKDLDRVRDIIRDEMIHMENPVRVPEKALEEYIALHMYRPRNKVTEAKTAPAEGRIPRRRNGKLAV